MNNYWVLGYCNHGFKEDLVVLVDSRTEYSDLGEYYPLVLPTMSSSENFDYLFSRKKFEYIQIKHSNSYSSNPMLFEEYKRFCYEYKENTIYPVDSLSDIKKLVCEGEQERKK